MPILRNRSDSFGPIAAAALFLLSCVAFGTDARAEQTLVFLTWADYIDPEVLAEFERGQDIKVHLQFYESDDNRDELLAERDGRGYDLVIVNGAMLHTYADRGWIARVDYNLVPNTRQIEDRWRTAFPGADRYGVPYFWGTLGIGYRADLVPEGFPSWSDFFRPDETLRGKISLLKNGRDVIGMALKSLGHSANTNDRDAIRQAGDLLLEQKPYVRSYEYVSLDQRSALVTGEIWATLIYSGDALMVQEHHDQIRYVVPKEGGNLWVDYLTVLQSSNRRDLALKFIDFLNRPDVAARNARYVYYATPNLAAASLLPTEFLEDPIIYPPDDVLKRSETFQDLAPRSQKTLNTVFANAVR